MLKLISPLISPDLMQVIMLMGHGDELVFADANFPALALARRSVRADGHAIPPLLEAVLPLFPVDTFVEDVAFVMEPVTPQPEPPVWTTYRNVLRHHEHRDIPLTPIPREAFYERARTAFAIVATSERTIYGNLILKKGIVAGA